jgi:mono/diheme cytochrome c family protein
MSEDMMFVKPMLAVLGSVLSLAGCTLQVQNTQPAQDHARAMQPPGSVYTGWRVFQDKCAACHGAAATGAGSGPDLTVRVREMGPRQFVNLVLNRYEWSLPAEERGRGGAGRDALVEEILQRRAGALMMPAWQGEPAVNAHVIDLYAYLSARAEGRQGPGRPAP